jgi:hypothetical protein
MSYSAFNKLSLHFFREENFLKIEKKMYKKVVLVMETLRFSHKCYGATQSTNPSLVLVYYVGAFFLSFLMVVFECMGSM